MKPHTSSLGYEPSVDIEIVDADGNEYYVHLNYELEWLVIFIPYCNIGGEINYKCSNLNEILQFLYNNLTPAQNALMGELIQSVKKFKYLMEVNPTWWKD